MSPVDFVVLALACWRLSNLLVDERGPFGLLARIREAVGVEHNSRGEPVSWPDDEPGYLIRCLDCTSVWVGLGLVGLYLATPGLAVLLALPFALSTVAILAGRWLRIG